MSEKTLNNIRIINKHDTEANWLKAVGFTPKQGEIIIYDIDSRHPYERIKIGDGLRNVNNLPFATNRSFVVTASRDADNNTSIDKTYQEIYDAVQSGMHVYMVTGNTVYVDGNSIWPDTILWLSYCSDYSVIFTHHDGPSEFEVEVDSDGGVSAYYSSSLPSKYSFGYEGMVLTVGENGEVNPADFPETIARISDVEEVKGLIGDTSVQDQIAAANMIYVGPDRPSDPNIKVWINTAEEGTGVLPVLPRIATITLYKSGWVGNKEPYSQRVNVATATASSKIDLQATAQQTVDLQNAETSLMIENNSGVVTCYAIGNKPTVDYTMQVLIQEVSYV